MGLVVNIIIRKIISPVGVGGGGSGKVYNMSQLPLCILLVHGEDLTYSLQLDLMLYPSKFCMKFCIKKTFWWSMFKLFTLENFATHYKENTIWWNTWEVVINALFVPKVWSKTQFEWPHIKFHECIFCNKLNKSKCLLVYHIWIEQSMLFNNKTDL